MAAQLDKEGGNWRSLRLCNRTSGLLLGRIGTPACTHSAYRRWYESTLAKSAALDLMRGASAQRNLQFWVVLDIVQSCILCCQRCPTGA